MSNTDLTQHRLRLVTFVFDPVARQVLDDVGRAVAVLRQSLRVLCELAADKEGAQMIEGEGATAPPLAWASSCMP